MAKKEPGRRPVRVRRGDATPYLTVVPNLKNFDQRIEIEEVRQAALNGDTGPPDPTDFNSLRGRLEAARTKLPPLYRDAVFRPYLQTLNNLGPADFISILLNDPRRERAAGLMLDIAHAVFQNGEQYQELASDAFQEVVSDLYEGFLRAEDRRVGIQPRDRGVIAPLVKWGNPNSSLHLADKLREDLRGPGGGRQLAAGPRSPGVVGLVGPGARDGPATTSWTDLLRPPAGRRGSRAFHARFRGKNLAMSQSFTSLIALLVATTVGLSDTCPRRGRLDPQLDRRLPRSRRRGSFFWSGTRTETRGKIP